jgi:hypothetical protein
LSIACGVGDIGTQANRIPERLVDKRFGDFARCRRSPGVFALLEVDDKNAFVGPVYPKAENASNSWPATYRATTCVTALPVSHGSLRPSASSLRSIPILGQTLGAKTGTPSDHRGVPRRPNDSRSIRGNWAHSCWCCSRFCAMA